MQRIRDVTSVDRCVVGCEGTTIFPRMRTTRRLVASLAVSAVVLAACGGASDEQAEDTSTTQAPEAPAEEEPAEEAPAEEEPEEAAPAEAPAEEAPVEEEPAEEAPAEEEPAEEAPVEEEPPAEEVPVEEEPPSEEEPADGGDVGEAITASLVEWAIEAPTEYAAGTITFNASNDGSFPHEFVVIRGEGYASLPLADGGAVIEDELPAGDLIARTARIGRGSVEELTVDLEPGNYVLVCNLGSGGTSHAGRGQNLDIVVS